MEFTLLGAALLAVGGLYGGLWLEGRGDATIRVRDLWEIGVSGIVAGLLVGRVVAMVKNGTNPITHPGDLLIIRGGVDTAGAALAALVTVAVAIRRDMLDRADVLAAPALAALAGWQGGCLVRDSCLGTPSDLPWAFALAGSDLTRHPVELYAALALVAGAVLLGWWRLRHPAPGLIGALALAAAGAIRLATEPLRPSLGAGPIPWYWAAVVSGLLGAAAAVGANRRRRREPG